jgi:hypothetical protein
VVRLVAAMVPSVCVLALVAYDYSEMSLGHSTSIHDSHADVAHIVDDHAEGGDHTVISALAAGQVRRSRCITTNMCLEGKSCSGSTIGHTSSPLRLGMVFDKSGLTAGGM